MSVIPLGKFRKQGGRTLSDFEILSLIISILGIVVYLLIEVFKNIKK